MASQIRAADDYMMGSVCWRILDDVRNLCISDRYQPLSLFLNLSASQTKAFPERDPAKNEKCLVPNSITPRLFLSAAGTRTRTTIDSEMRYSA